MLDVGNGLLPDVGTPNIFSYPHFGAVIEYILQ
jgi:hypothetical protein